MKTGLGLHKFLYVFILNPYKFSQWASDVLWTSNGRLYEVWTSYRHPLDVQKMSNAHWVVV